MSDQLSKLKHISFMGLVLVIGSIIFSCKKDSTRYSETLTRDDAKSWYDSSAGQSASKLRSSNGQDIPLEEKVKWDEASQLNFEDGSTGLIIPLEMKVSSTSVSIKGSFSLLLSKIKGKFRAVRLYTPNDGSKNDQTPVLGSDVKREYKAILDGNNALINMQSPSKGAISNLKTSKNKASIPQKYMVRDSGGGGDLPGEPCIIDWFLVVTYTDWLGHILGEYELYMGSTPCNEGTNPEFSYLPEETVNWGTPVDEDFSSTTIDEESEGGELRRRKLYTWTYHKLPLGDMSYLKSHDRSFQKKVGNDWHFTSLEHLTQSRTGGSINLTVDMIDAFTSFHETTGFIKLSYTMTKSASFEGNTASYSSPLKHSSKNIHSND